jgi:hypothetical protein
MQVHEQKKDEKPLGRENDQSNISSNLDPILNELKLPSGYFEHEIGDEHVLKAEIQNSSRIYIPPEDFDPTKAPAETNDYKILEEEDGKVSKFLLKGEKEYVVILEKTEHSIVLAPMSKLVEDSLNLAQKYNMPSPMGEIKCINPGVIKYEAIDEFGKINTYLASPDFVLEKDAAQSVPQALTRELETLHKGIEKLQSEQSISTFDEIQVQMDKASELYKEIEKRAKPRKDDQSSYSLEFDSKDDEKQYKEVCIRINELREMRSSLRKSRDLQQEAQSLNEDIVNLESYHGYLEEGDSVGATLIGRQNDLSFYDNAGIKIIERTNSSPYEDPILGLQSTYSILDLRQDNNTKDYFIVADQHNKIKREYIQNGDEIFIEERYDRKDGLKERRLNYLGIIETYNQVEVVDKKVDNIHIFFKNIEVLKDVPGFDQMLSSASEKFSQTFIKQCYKIDNANTLNLAERAISMMPYESIIEASKYMANKLSNSEEQAELKDGQVKLIKEISDRLDFRRKMIEDGRELTRYDIKFDDFRTTSIFNDSKSREYFGIKDEWIDPERSPVKELLNNSNIELSTKELKLLVSRFLFDKNLPTNKESVIVALTEISNLREEYKDLDPFLKRNIVFASHSDTLIDYRSSDKYEYFDQSKDHHQLGKASLLKDLKSKIGPEGDLKLFRVELDNLPSSEQILEILIRAEIPSEASSKILEAFEASPLAEGQRLTLIHLTKVIQDHGFDEEMGRVVDLVRGTENERIEKLKQIKNDTLKAIETTPPPFTFIFEGHGGPNYLYLSDGHIGKNKIPEEHEDTIKISSEEIVAAFQKRHENFGSLQKENKDVLIFQDCYNSNFIRRLSSSLVKENMPVIFGSSEFNQLSLFSLGSEYGALFLSEVMGIRNGLKTNVGEIIKRQLDDQVIEVKDVEKVEKYNINTNPGIYVPDKEGNLIQVSQIKSKDSSSDIS